MNERNYTIDLLRFLSAFWVAVFHFNEPIGYIDNWYRNFAKIGHLGVPVFFVISGYCIMLTANRSVHAIDFFNRRVFRIFPAYWFSLLVVLGVVVFQKITTAFNSVTVLPEDFKSIVAIFTLLTDPVTTIPTINWVYWSLSYEIFFYLIIAVGLCFSYKLRILFLFFISLLALSLPVYPHGVLFFLQHWPTFALGLGVYLLFSNSNKKECIGATLILVISLITLLKNFMFHQQKAYFITAITASVFIILSHYIKLKNNILSRMGDYSYAVYLIHVPIGVYLIGRLKSTTIQQNLVFNIVFDLSAYLLVLFLAYLIFRWVELPTINMGKRISKKYFIAKNVETILR